MILLSASYKTIPDSFVLPMHHALIENVIMALRHDTTRHDMACVPINIDSFAAGYFSSQFSVSENHMGMGWTFYSFEKSRWDEIFGASDLNAERHVIASAIWDSIDWEDMGAGVDVPDPETDIDGYLDAVVPLAPEPVAS